MCYASLYNLEIRQVFLRFFPYLAQKSFDRLHTSNESAVTPNDGPSARRTALTLVESRRCPPHTAGRNGAIKAPAAVRKTCKKPIAFFLRIVYNRPAKRHPHRFPPRPDATKYPGLAKFGIALGLGACNTPGIPEKSEIPQSLVITGVFALPLPRKLLEHGPLTTCLTTTAKTEKRISGCSATGSAPALGAGCWEFKSPHSDQKSSEITDFRGFFAISVISAVFSYA